MDLRLLRYFVACVEHRTMHAAAQVVHISQPALSKAIADLEGGLEVKLLDRLPRGVVPTPYGVTLFRYAKMIDSEVRRATAEIDAMRGATRGTIVIGVIPTMSSLIGEVAHDIFNRHPGLKLKLHVAFSNEIIPALLGGELDLALLLLTGEKPPSGLAFEPLIETSPIVVVRKDHPLAGRGRSSLQELAAYPWLLPDYPTSHGVTVHRAYTDAGLPPPFNAISVSTVVLFSSLIGQSDLVSVVPSTLLSARARSDLAALDTDLVFPPERVGLAVREHSTLLPGAGIVVKLIRSKCAEVDGHLSWHEAQRGHLV